MTDKASLFPHDNSIMGLVINSNIEKDYTQLLIYIDDKVIDATHALKKEIRCPIIRGSDVGTKSYEKYFKLQVYLSPLYEIGLQKIKII